MTDDPMFFERPEDFRSWLSKNHSSAESLWVGYYKKSTGRPSIDWPQSVDQALCFGWIDGIRKKIDDESYKIRFTPRKPRSHWSRVNIDKVKQLKKAGLMEKAGLDAFKKLDPENSEKASFEQNNVELPAEYERIFRENKKAWDFFLNLAPGYRKQSIWYVIQAKREETRLKRLGLLINHSKKGEKIPVLRAGGK